MLRLIRSKLSISSGSMIRYSIVFASIWLAQSAIADTGVLGSNSSKGYVLTVCDGQGCVSTAFLIWVGWLLVLALLILPVVYWRFRNKQEEEQKGFFKYYWQIIKEAYLWFRWSNIIAIALTALWAGFAHSQIGDALGHSILVLALLHTILTAFEHQLSKFEETPDRITKTIKEEIAKSIKDQRIYVSGLQATGIDDVLHAIRHKETLKDSRHGFALFRFNADVIDYANVCEDCLVQTEKSVKSMSDFDFDEGFPEFCNGKPALVWTKKVNDKTVAKKNLKVHRVQVMTYARLELVKNLNRYIQDKGDIAAKNGIFAYSRVSPNGSNETVFLDHLESGLANYRLHYWISKKNFSRNLLLRTSSNLGSSIAPVASYQNHDKLACGEFILFDDDVLVRYSPSAKLLEVLIGKPVKEFSDTFDYLAKSPVDWDFERADVEFFGT